MKQTTSGGAAAWSIGGKTKQQLAETNDYVYGKAKENEERAASRIERAPLLPFTTKRMPMTRTTTKSSREKIGAAAKWSRRGQDLLLSCFLQHRVHVFNNSILS